VAITKKRQFGDWGEEQASLFLVRQNYEIITKNCLTKYGELDIVAWGKDEKIGRILCFIEVKTRGYGEESAEKATDWEKIKRMKLTAKIFCYQNKIDVDNTFIKFEHVSVYVNRSQNLVTFKKYLLPTF